MIQKEVISYILTNKMLQFRINSVSSPYFVQSKKVPLSIDETG